VYVGISASAGYYPIKIFLVTNKFNQYTGNDKIKLVHGIRTGPFTWHCTPIDYHPAISAKSKSIDATTQTESENESDDSSSISSDSESENSDPESEIDDELYEVMIHSILAPFTIEIFEFATQSDHNVICFSEFFQSLKQTCEEFTSNRHFRSHSAPIRPLSKFDLMTKVAWIHRPYELENLNVNETHSCTFQDCLISWMIKHNDPQYQTRPLNSILIEYVLFLFKKYYRTKDRKAIKIDFLELFLDLPYSVKNRINILFHLMIKSFNEVEATYYLNDNITSSSTIDLTVTDLTIFDDVNNQSES